MRKACLVPLLIMILFSACKKDGNKNIIKKQDSTTSTVPDTSRINYVLPDTVLTKYDGSYNTWLDFKQSHGNSYVFVMIFDQGSINNHFIITTKVQNGVVVARDFVSYKFVADPPNTVAKKDTTDQWHEEGATLNTHQDGGPLMTLDYIYTHAKTDWLNVDPTQNYLYFETKNQGLISKCGSIGIFCMDDCYFGIQDISSITPL